MIAQEIIQKIKEICETYKLPLVSSGTIPYLERDDYKDGYDEGYEDGQHELATSILDLLGDTKND